MEWELIFFLWLIAWCLNTESLIPCVYSDYSLVLGLGEIIWAIAKIHASVEPSTCQQLAAVHFVFTCWSETHLEWRAWVFFSPERGRPTMSMEPRSWKVKAVEVCMWICTTRHLSSKPWLDYQVFSMFWIHPVFCSTRLFLISLCILFLFLENLRCPDPLVS